MQIKIGLELHVTLKTATKLFSAVGQTLFAPPNTQTALIDWGYPGTLPQVNQHAIKLGYQLGHLLHCQLSSTVSFDRKHYYYFDLPKGYQITQLVNPIARNGFFMVLLPTLNWKKVPILTAHLEEDTAKVNYQDGKLLINYNRAGNALIEITTAPVLTNYVEVKSFVQQMVQRLKHYQFSDANFANGSIRIDLNISTCFDPTGQVWHARNEIKNLNSLANLDKAIQLEIALQQQHWQTQSESQSQSWTKNFDEASQKLVILRRKFTSFDYMFIPEGNIIPISLAPTLRRSWIATLPSPDEYQHIIQQYQLNYRQAQLLLRYQLIAWLTQLHAQGFDLTTIFEFFQQVLIPLQKQTATDLKQTRLYQLAGFLLKQRAANVVNWQTLTAFFHKMVICDECDWQQAFANRPTIITLNAIETKALLDKICQKYPDLKARYLANSQATTNFLVGQLHQAATQKLDIQLVLQLIKTHFETDSN